MAAVDLQLTLSSPMAKWFRHIPATVLVVALIGVSSGCSSESNHENSPGSFQRAAIAVCKGRSSGAPTTTPSSIPSSDTQLFQHILLVFRDTHSSSAKTNGQLSAVASRYPTDPKALKLEKILRTWSTFLNREESLISEMSAVLAKPQTPVSTQKLKSLTSSYGQLNVGMANEVINPLSSLLPGC